MAQSTVAGFHAHTHGPMPNATPDGFVVGYGQETVSEGVPSPCKAGLPLVNHWCRPQPKEQTS